ncbi:MAG: hypothetical protein ABW328_00495 [Ilumatobacteraceae bacterium]
MDRGPLPPHERPWRHPSELGPPEHEPTTNGGKALIVTTATLSLLLVGVLAIAMTPDRSAAPEAAASTISGLRSAPAGAAALDQPPLPMVTPIGHDGWAITTMSALAGHSGSITARLPSGSVVDVEIVSTDRGAGVTFVSLPEVAESSYELADTEPAPSDTVLVHGDPPRVVPMVQLVGLDVDEATPVLDDAGHLVGLCTKAAGGTALRMIHSMPGSATTTTVAATRPSPTAVLTIAPQGASTTPTTAVAGTPPTASTVPSTPVTSPPSPTATVPASTGRVVTTVAPPGPDRQISDGAATTAPR